MADLNPPQLSIDNYQDLIAASLEHMKVVSNGTITDTSPAGFMRPFAGTLAFVASETLFKANLAAEAAAKSFLSEVVGIPKDEGVKATTTVEFVLSAQLTTNFVIPAGFQLSDSGGGLRFYTDLTLVIPPGALAGQTTAVAENVGDTYNLSAGLVNKFAVPLTYLKSIINVTSATGGRDPETPTDLIERAAIAIRTRNPVSGIDFEQLSTLILGEGSRAKAIGLLAADKQSKQLGAVHLFLLNPDGTQPSQAQLSNVGQKIATRLMLGTTLLVSPIELFEIYVDAIVDATSGELSDTIASNCFEALKNYFSNKTVAIGGDILLEEIKYVLRDTGGIIINYAEINGSPENITMPTRWTMPRFTGINISIVNGQSTFSTSLFIPVADE